MKQIGIDARGNAIFAHGEVFILQTSVGTIVTNNNPLKPKGVQVLGYNDQLPFGQYKGMTVKSVLCNDAQYIKWCIENMVKYKFTPYVHKLVY